MLGFDRRRLKTPTKKEMRLSQQRKNGAENEANSCFNLFSTSQWGARVGLFIGEVNGLIKMS
jgi:hypothetical protein